MYLSVELHLGITNVLRTDISTNNSNRSLKRKDAY
jgi:hypothetical protein